MSVHTKYNEEQLEGLVSDNGTFFSCMLCSSGFPTESQTLHHLNQEHNTQEISEHLEESDE